MELLQSRPAERQFDIFKRVEKHLKKKKESKESKYFTVGSQDPSGRIQLYPHLVLQTLDLEAYVER